MFNNRGQSFHLHGEVKCSPATLQTERSFLLTAYTKKKRENQT